MSAQGPLFLGLGLKGLAPGLDKSMHGMMLIVCLADSMK